MTFVDKTLACKDCGKGFTFTAGEQEFYKSKGLMNEPGRCPDCRSSRRQSRSGGRGPSGNRTMHSAVCARCGAETEVPFEPRQERPVYCSDCYAKIKTAR